jgi:hypothetical protein
MPRKDYKHHIFYKMTNLINDKFYYGMHSCHCDDHSNCKYKGSGTRLWYSKQKYGIKNFHIEHLKFFATRKELAQFEKEFVTLDFIKSNQPLCMNIKEGGEGGWEFIHDNDELEKEIASKGGKIIQEKYRNNPIFKEERDKITGNTFKKLWKEGKLTYCDWTGKSHKQESKDKIGLANSISQKGEKNSQFGSKWINNGTDIKKINSTQLETYLQNGWKLGRSR